MCFCCARLSRSETGRKVIETVPGRGYRFTAPLETQPQAGHVEERSSQIIVNASLSVTQVTIEEEELDTDLSATDGLADRSRRAKRIRWMIGRNLAFVALIVCGSYGGSALA
jgi:hypothetical protein